jgi:iron complex outermembrane recepter protein
MTVSNRALLLGLGALTLWAGASQPALAQDAPTEPSVTEEEIVITGTRVVGRTRLDSVAPVDVIGAEALANAGSTELNQALTVSLPSFTFPRPAITDGTDSLRPATLRGLAPDQTLVLVNSKRRHASALVNINGSIGRGSAAVDLNTIPTAAISSVEVLRDGASAQYGSDAIAGVINLRLREASEGGAVSYTFGRYFTSVDTTRAPERSVDDGTTTTVSGWAGLPLLDDGFVTISGEFLKRDPTSRGDFDPRVIATGQPSPTGSLVTSRYGDPEVEQGTFYVNAGLPLGVSGWEAYGWLGHQSRSANSAANPRLRQNLNGTPNVTAVVPSVTPSGFLPLIAPDIYDTTGAVGVRGALAGWDTDLSVAYGQNRLKYFTINSLNASIALAQTTPGNPRFGQTPQRNFYAGALGYEQVTANLGFTQTFGADTVTPVTISFGFEYRDEEYSIKEGEPSSYAFGLGTNGLPIRVDAAGNVVLSGGSTVGGGSQGFPGLRPTDAGTDSRDAFSAYAEAEANLTEKFIASIAARFEDYSDFGETLNGKLSARYDFTDVFALRGAVSSGFRAPSLQQSSFTSQATNFVNGNPREILTLPATDPVSLALGAQPLKPELSTNYSIGGVVRGGGFELTVDAYRIDISDRIVLSDNLGEQGGAADAGVDAIIAGVRPGVDGARFFINGVDSETKGIDVVARYGFEFDFGDIDFTASGNINETEITKVPSTAVLSALAVPPVLFPVQRVLEFQRGTPAQKYSLAVDYGTGPFEATLRATHYGKVLVPQANGALTYDLPSSLVLDAEARMDLGKFDIGLGVNNFLDEYPAVTPTNVNTNGPTAFSSFSPFGFNGRYVHARVGYKW